MKCSFKSIADSFLAHVLVKATTHLSEQEQKQFFVVKGKDGKYDIRFIVDGVELPVEKVFEGIEKQIDRMVFEKANELIEQKMEDIVSELVETVSSVKSLIVNKLKAKLLDKGLIDGTERCKNCYSLLDDVGWCTSETCLFYNCGQGDLIGWV